MVLVAERSRQGDARRAKIFTEISSLIPARTSFHNEKPVYRARTFEILNKPRRVLPITFRVDSPRAVLPAAR